ncbi:hypothetical protein bthur0004_18310 [Bacillus thuringiensis serovar sotto str. T04001]|uniref:Uncharacterized protein n=1 Tax=Bacillus cereus (strain G9842) TaxID=405531 RepID=B7IT89_BACC2|nr:hypothetical protein BCG9842_B3351 [Bacillus cereus G9842]EEM42179.1 hypothetical protein bthur0004_18310 [Bacillus thuringiensis serovar sotto str. T04001]
MKERKFNLSLFIEQLNWWKLKQVKERLFKMQLHIHTH